MTDVKVKICGITSPDDAVDCHRLGADYLGVIFADSPRRVSAERAGEIRRSVPDARLVGVFADAEIAQVAETARMSGLDIIQLHGDETPGYCITLLATARLPIIKTFRRGAVPELPGLALYGMVSYFLLDLDKQDPNAEGTASELWAEAARVRRSGCLIFLAGGLGPSNVRAAVEQTSPFCVDVSRGVEKVPGVKDAEAVRCFIAEVRR